MSFRLPANRVQCIGKFVYCRGLRGYARDFKLRAVRAHTFKEDHLVGLEVLNDKPKDKPHPVDTRSAFKRQYFTEKPTYRFPIVALDPAFKPPNLEFDMFKPPAKYFPATPEEAGLAPMVYLNHRDMWRRKQTLDIPYFCEGCYMAVTCGDPNHPLGVSRFVGMCVLTRFNLMGSTFHVANVIEGMPVKKQYDLFGPFLQKIEVLKAERRTHRFVLNWLWRKKDPKHYTVPEDMQDENPPGRDPYDKDVPLKEYVEYADKPKFRP